LLWRRQRILDGLASIARSLFQVIISQTVSSSENQYPAGSAKDITKNIA
jgi:hypothetical protein